MCTFSGLKYLYSFSEKTILRDYRDTYSVLSEIKSSLATNRIDTEFREINQLRSESKKINTELPLYPENIAGEKVILKNLLTSSPKLVFDLGNINCIKCIERDLEKEVNIIKKTSLIRLALKRYY